MLVLGIGIGLCMQVLTIIVQNTVDYRDLGVATSGVTFFRTLGSSFGAAVFGTVYSNVLRHSLPGGHRQVRASTRATVATPKALHAHPGGADRADRRRLRPRHPRRVPGRRAGGRRRVRALAVPQGGAVARHGAGRRRATSATPSACPRPADNCGAAAAGDRPAVRQAGHGDDAGKLRPSRRAPSSTSSDGWCVGQVHIRLQGRRRHQPATRSPAGSASRPRCCAPAFEIARRRRLPGRRRGRSCCSPTRASEEIDKLVAEMRAWLADELSDWGAGDDALLSEALEVDGASGSSTRARTSRCHRPSRSSRARPGRLGCPGHTTRSQKRVAPYTFSRCLPDDRTPRSQYEENVMRALHRLGTIGVTTAFAGASLLGTAGLPALRPRDPTRPSRPHCPTGVLPVQVYGAPGRQGSGHARCLPVARQDRLRAAGHSPRSPEGRLQRHASR